MKYQVLCALLGLSAANEEPVNEEFANIDEVCKEYEQLDEQSLVELENSAELDLDKASFQQGRKFKAAVNKQNKNILATEKLCKKWVVTHKRHNVICKWCNKKVQPSVHWKFYGGVWYRWYDNKWHYWGPSRGGYGGRWRWSGGYWRHNGYTYKYTGGRWYRFYNNRWNYYSRMIPINPRAPKTARTCVKVYHQVKAGVPTSLTTRRVPRCQVGRAIYMWGGSKVCKVLGGRLTYRRVAKCKAGRAHKWRRVTKCTGGDVYRPQTTYETLNLQTQLVSGRAMDIGVGGDKVMVIGTGKVSKYGYGIYDLQSNNKFKRVAGTATNIAVDEKGIPGVIDGAGYIYYNRRSNNRLWNRISGRSQDLGLGGGQIWTVNSNKKFGGNGAWKKNLKKGAWKRMSSSALKSVDVDARGNAMVVHVNGNIYFHNGRKWFHIPGKAIDVAANGNSYAVVGTNKRVYRYNHVSKGWAATNWRNGFRLSLNNDGRLHETTYKARGYIYRQKK